MCPVSLLGCEIYAGSGTATKRYTILYGPQVCATVILHLSYPGIRRLFVADPAYGSLLRLWTISSLFT